APRFAARQRHRFLAAARQLEQAAAALAARRRDGARAEKIAGSQIAAVGGVMRDHLRRRPIEVPRIAGRQAMRREARFAHRLGLDQQIERDVESARRLIVLVEQGGKRRRIAGGARRLRDAERRQRLGGHDPRRDAGMDAFREERTERLIFPALYVARRPVVEQAEPDQMISGLRYRNRRAQRIAGADPETELELVIEAARRAEARLRLLGPLALAARAPYRLARGTHGR